MSQAPLYEILERIQQLPAEDRLLLGDLLARQEDVEWREEAARARAVHAVRLVDLFGKVDYDPSYAYKEERRAR